MKSALHVDPRYQPRFDQLQLDTCDAVFKLLGKAAAVTRADVIIERRILDVPQDARLDVYFKQYCFPKPSFRFWLRASKARREFENYATFERLGIPCARRVACGETRDAFGRLAHAFIITETIPDAGSLLDWLPTTVQSRERVSIKPLQCSLAQSLRHVHDAGFFHNDLYLRNLLLNGTNLSNAWWIDCPRGRYARLPLRRRHLGIKDLASLDLDAQLFCTLRERVGFLKLYLGAERWEREGRALLSEIDTYRRNRWPAKNKAHELTRRRSSGAFADS